MSAERLTRTIGGRWHGSYGTACCPSHEDRNPSLQISDGETAILLKCHAGCESRAVIDALKARNLWADSRDETVPYKRPHRPPQPRQDADAAKRSEIARDTWSRALEASDSPVQRYLESRGITAMPPLTIRYLAAAKHSNTGLFLPCMIAAITRWPSREICAVHRTFLTASGSAKAPVTSNKKMLGPVGGGAVRFAPHGPKLAIGEGIESALTVWQSTGIPTWAALSASNLPNVILPDDAREIMIAADNDRPGLDAAEKAASQWTRQGRNVRIMIPPNPGEDFNDMLKGVAA